MTRPMGAILTQIMERWGAGRASKGALAVARWPEFAGPVIAAHARARHVKRGVLTVAVDSHVWATELTTYTPVLVDRINSAVGPGTVTSIRFDAGRYDPRGPGLRGRGPVGPDDGALAWAQPDVTDLAAVRLPPEDQDLVRDLSARAGDPELSRAVGRWLTLALKARRWKGEGREPGR